MAHEITPYSIRLDLLKLAEEIVATNVDKHNQDIFWKYEHLPIPDQEGSEIHLETFTVEEVLKTAQTLRDFIDNK
jgi:hypothetical protein